MTVQRWHLRRSCKLIQPVSRAIVFLYKAEPGFNLWYLKWFPIIPQLCQEWSHSAVRSRSLLDHLVGSKWQTKRKVTFELHSGAWDFEFSDGGVCMEGRKDITDRKQGMWRNINYLECGGKGRVIRDNVKNSRLLAPNPGVSLLSSSI